MKFSDMPYSRPNGEECKKTVAELTARLKSAASYEEARGLYMELEELEKHFSTMASLANIRHDINTQDEFYDNEVNYLDNIGPELEEYLQEWTGVLLESPYRPQFEEEFGTLPFLNMEIQRKTFSPAIIGDLQKENELTTEYSKLLASAQIPFEGQVYTLSQLQPFRVDPDDSRRLAAWQATGQFFADNAQRLDEIYDQLVKLRTSMGRTLGCKDYVRLGYWRMERNCYTEEDIKKFRAAVVKYLVPVADEIYRAQARRLGKEYPLNYADAALEFRSGNPRPAGTPDDILATGKAFYEAQSPETAEFIHFMYDNGLLDVLSRTGKAGGGYCTDLPDYKAPFIFANFNGTSGDVEVITHEAGHAFAAYMGRDIVPACLQQPTMEACEVHSMSMEFFGWNFADRFFGKDARKFRYTHLSGALTFIPYGTMVDHFQHIVYENPDLTPAQRNEEWARLTKIYMPWMKLDPAIPFFSEGRAWQRQMHIYQMPFYYIDYCLAQTMSLQFWAMIQEDPKKAWETYMAYTRQSGTKTFTGLVEGAGLRTPFDETVLRDVCKKAENWLKNYDLSGLE